MTIALTRQAELVNDILFANKIGQAAYKFALEVANEAPETPQHQARKSMANMILINFAIVQEAFVRAVATRIDGIDPSDADINGSVRAVWNSLALAMFPGLK